MTMGRGGPGTDAEGDPEPSEQTSSAPSNSTGHGTRSGPGTASAPAKTTLKHYPEGSVGDGYQRADGDAQGAARQQGHHLDNKEQEKRDSWPRAWKWIEPKFGDCDPKTIEPEHFLRLDPITGKAMGLVPEIEAAVSITERHMVIKVWRALWKKMGSMNRYCDPAGKDPAKSFPNTPPGAARDQVWLRWEVLRLVQVAWRHKYYGLAALMAVAWDGQLSPIDNRSLTLAQARRDTRRRSIKSAAHQDR